MYEIGVCLRSVDTSPAEFAQLAAYGEKLGYSSFWVTEETGRSGFGNIMYAASKTSAVKLGTAIVSIYSRTPLTVAMEAATLDEATDSRFILGLGSGGMEFTERGHGVKAEKPVKRMHEYLKIVRAFLSGERVSYEGEFFRVRDIRMWAKPAPHLQVCIAALNRLMLRKAGEMADGVILNVFSPRALPYVMENLEIGAASTGRKLSSFKLYSFVLASSSSSEEARKALKNSVAFYCAAPTYRQILSVLGFGEVAAQVNSLWRAGSREEALKLIPNELVDDVSVTIDTDDAVDMVMRYVEAGIRPLLYPQPRKSSRLEDIRAIMENMSSKLDLRCADSEAVGRG